MNKRIIIGLLVFLLTVGTATAVIIDQAKFGPLVISKIGGQIVQATFTNAFRGSLLPVVGGILLINDIVKIVRNTDLAAKAYNLIPGKDNTPPIPQGWTDPGNIPPSTTNPTQGYRSNYSTTVYPTREQACQSIIANNPAYDGWTYAGLQYGYVCILKDKTGYPNTNFYTSVSTTCPTGYTLNGSTCTLTNPSVVQWPADGTPTIVTDPGGTFKNHPSDPDVSTEPGIDSSTLSRSGTDSNNNPVQESYTATPDGGVDHERRLQTKNAAGNDVVEYETIHYDSYGRVTSHATGSQPGTLDTQNPSQPLPTAPPGSGPSNPIYTQPGNVNVNVNIPQITVSGDGGIIPQFDRGDTPDTETITRRLSAKFHSQTIVTQLKNFAPQSSTPVCPLVISLSISPFGQSWNLQTDVMCRVWDAITPVLDITTRVAFTWAAVVILFMA